MPYVFDILLFTGPDKACKVESNKCYKMRVIACNKVRNLDVFIKVFLGQNILEKWRQ